ncbi:VUT family protein [Legionella fairfieldensis]|uniref:VUT family protein n=1 Tax=Legionella fairfieldensis TaxID=45064 RepID=UPI000A7D5C2C|nr:VUT family protein [Legionella fairfieldensis]
MTVFPTSLPGRSCITLTGAMIICLILLINVSFKIIAMHSLVFTANSILCALVAIVYLLVLKRCSPGQQRHILNQCLLALYVFSIGIYLLVNLPAAEYMYGNPVYRIIFDDIPKKFFAATLAFGLSFYLPHMLWGSQQEKIATSLKKMLLFIVGKGVAFFTLNFLLLFCDVPIHSYLRIYFNSLMINVALLLAGVSCFAYFLRDKSIKKRVNNRHLSYYLASPLYHYLVSFSVIILLICLACEYRLVSFANGLTLVASGLIFPLAIVGSNLISELYGYKASLLLAFILILTELAFELLIMGIVTLPSPAFFNLNPFYLVVMPRRIFAGALALLVTFVSNAMLLEKLRHSYFTISRGVRILIANIVATSLLCLVNYSLLYAGIYPGEQILNLTLTTFVYKSGASLVGVRLTLWLSGCFHKRLAWSFNDASHATK